MSVLCEWGVPSALIAEVMAALSDFPGWYAAVDRVGWDVFGHHCTGTDYGTVADGDILQYSCIGTYPNIVANVYRKIYATKIGSVLVVSAGQQACLIGY
jgi:hypothetical protein